MRGLLIVLEGPDGCGKTTQARLLKERLVTEGYDAFEVREPGGTAWGEHLRDMLAGDFANIEFPWKMADEPLESDARLFLFLAARAQLYTRVVRPALDRGQIIVCDRGPLSTVVYQGILQGRDELDPLWRLTAFAAGGLMPNLTLLFDVPAPLLAERLAARSDTDADDILRLNRLRNAYAVALSNGQRLIGGFPGVDGRGTPEQVAERAWEPVAYLLGQIPEPVGPKRTHQVVEPVR